MRPVWFLLGLVSVALGLIGAVLPLLPTVPFMILAAFFFARSSPRFHDWLMNHRVFGSQIKAWREDGAIGRQAKWYATASLAIAFSISLLLGVRPLYLVIQAIVLLCVLVFIWSRPDRRTPQDHAGNGQ